MTTPCRPRSAPELKALGTQQCAWAREDAQELDERRHGGADGQQEGRLDGSWKEESREAGWTEG